MAPSPTPVLLFFVYELLLPLAGFNTRASQAGSSSQQRSYQRTMSRVSSMASPQLPGTQRSSSGGGGGGDASNRANGQASRGDATKGLQQLLAKGVRHILVLGWQESAVPDLALQLQGLVTSNSKITVVLPPAADSEQHPDSTCSRHPAVSLPGQREPESTAVMPNVSVVRAADPGCVQALLDAGITNADAVIVGPALSSAAQANIEADALVTAVLLSIQQALHVSGTKVDPSTPADLQRQAASGPEAAASCSVKSRLHVVAVLGGYSARRALRTFLSSVLLQCSFSYELLVLDEFAAGMLLLVSLVVTHGVLIRLMMLIRCKLGVER